MQSKNFLGGAKYYVGLRMEITFAVKNPVKTSRNREIEIWSGITLS